MSEKGAGRSGSPSDSGRRHLANTYNRFDPTSPFAACAIGFGREGGRHGLEAYLNV